MNKIFINDLYKCALLSKLANKTPHDFMNEIDKDTNLGYLHQIVVNNKIHYISENTTSCFLLKNDNLIFICPYCELDMNVNNKLISIHGKIKVHKCIFLEYEKIKNGIIKHISKLSENNNVAHLYISGHSISGSLASLIAYDLSERYKYLFITSCFLYNSPIIGNKEFILQSQINIGCIYNTFLKDNDYDIDKIVINEDNILYISQSKKMTNFQSFFKWFLHYDKYIDNDNIDIYISRFKCILFSDK